MVFRTVCVAALAAAASAVPQESALPGTPAYRPLPVGDVVPEVRPSPSMAVRLRVPGLCQLRAGGLPAPRPALLSACAL